VTTNPQASQPTWAVHPLVDCYDPYLVWPVIITQPESWCLFYCPTDGGRPSQPRHCSSGVQPVPNAVAVVISTTSRGEIQTWVLSHWSHACDPEAEKLVKIAVVKLKVKLMGNLLRWYLLIKFVIIFMNMIFDAERQPQMKDVICSRHCVTVVHRCSITLCMVLHDYFDNQT